MLRPRPARWFEILAAKDDATLLLEALAATGKVELEPRTTAAMPPVEGIGPLLAQFTDLATRYGPYWARTKRRYSSFPEPPLATLAHCLDRLHAWARDAEPLVAELQQLEAERSGLEVWHRALDSLAQRAIDLTQLSASGGVLAKRLLILAPGAALEVPRDVAVEALPYDETRDAALVVGRPEAVHAVEQQAAAVHAQVHTVPALVAGSARESRERIAARCEALERRRTTVTAALDALEARHDLGRALGDAQRLAWLRDNVHSLERTDLLCWVTGWTSDWSGETLERAVSRSGARALLHFPPVPGVDAPLLLDNPWWARPFELFSRALGMPARDEADPSVLLAFAVPIMFGYMFGDVGQGVLIALAAFLLRRRYAVARLLIAGGIAAALFGFLFGSAFSMHAIPALWVVPLDAPLAVLVVPIAGGALLLTLGLVLDAIEAYWRGELARCFLEDAGFVATYAGLVAATLWPLCLALSAAGAVLFCIGRAARARKASAGLIAIGELLERLAQIVINTLSFARVGAFALAHAGLSSAIGALVEAAPSAAIGAIVLVLGNVVVLALETMVVAIQTTRLVLFEFFTRFLGGHGRVFRPLAAPPSLGVLQET